VTAARDQLATNATNHRRRADAAEPSLLVGVLVDARGERLTPAHAVKKGRRYRFYVSGALTTDSGTDGAQAWRLPAQEVEDAVIRVLTAALPSPAMLLERIGTAGVPSDQTRKMLNRATCLAAALNRSPAQRAEVVRNLIEKVAIEENAITIRIRRSALSGGAVAPPSSENLSDSTVELTAPVDFRRRGVEMKLMLPELTTQNEMNKASGSSVGCPIG
jgi:site-specific DNA recombinase